MKKLFQCPFYLETDPGYKIWLQNDPTDDFDKALY